MSIQKVRTDLHLNAIDSSYELVFSYTDLGVEVDVTLGVDFDGCETQHTFTRASMVTFLTRVIKV